VLGGRFVQQRLTCDLGGQPFEELAISGYDNCQRRYVGVRMDTVGSGQLCTSGYYDDKTQTMTEAGQFLTADGVVHRKVVTHQLSQDRLDCTSYQLLPDGSDRKLLDVRLTRRANPVRMSAAGSRTR
jgi:hypothetical protein